MGCLSSKSVANGPTTRRVTPVSNHVLSGRVSGLKRKSIDSGIDVGAEEKGNSLEKNASSIGNRDNPTENESKRKNIAFEIPASKNSIIKSHPPKKLLSRLTVTRNGSGLDPVRRNAEEKEKLRQLVQKQVRAEQIREQERHSVVARQKRREARARKVQERRRKLQEDLENWTDDDDLSDVENDENFNTAEDYDFAWDDDDGQQQSNHSDDDVMTEDRDDETDYEIENAMSFGVDESLGLDENGDSASEF